MGGEATTSHDERPWTAADYLLHGRYCDAEEIVATLASLRELSNARVALLLAFRGETLFHSLLLLSHRDPQQRRESQRALFGALLKYGQEEPPFVVFDPTRDDPHMLVGALVQRPPFSAVATLLEGSLTVLTRRPRSADMSEHDIVPAAIHVILTNATVTADRDEVAETMERLLYMVNASAPVVVHGNLAAEQDVEKALNQLARTHEHKTRPVRDNGAPGGGIRVMDPDEIPGILLRGALQLTGSSVGNVYFDTGQQDLALQEKVRNAWPRKHIQLDDARSIVAWVYERGRPMVINDPGDFLRTHDGWEHTSRPEDPLEAYAELAVPIVQSRLDTGDGAVIGVITVEKVNPLDRGHYSYRDLTVLRLIAHRLSSWRSQLLLSRFSRSLAELTRHNSITRSPLASVDQEDETPPNVPIDALPAKPIIDMTLRSIFDLTRSQSATVRLVSLDQRQLVRFSAFPPECLDDDHDEIPVRAQASINAWVARTGQLHYMPRTKQRTSARQQGTGPHPRRATYLEARPGTVSELCLPIFVGGRFAGTLNLESRYRDGYADSLDVARAVTEQVGLALQHARRAQEQAVFSMTIAATANQHQIFREVDVLRKLASRPYRLLRGGRRRLLGVANSIEELIDPGTEEVNQESMTTQEIFDDILRQLKFTNLFVQRNEPPIVVHHAGIRASMLRVVFEELLRNAHAEAVNVALDCWVRWGRFDAGGRTYLTLAIANPLARSVRSPRAELLYRVPLHSDSDTRTHIGAYTAAALMRSLGGDIRLAHSERPRFIVDVQLPVEPEIEETTKTKEAQ